MKKRNIGIILSYTNTILNMVCGLFLSSFLLRRLGDSEYGVYQTVSSFANYLVLLEFGTGTVIARNLSACRARGEGQEAIEKNVSTVWLMTNILALIITAVSIGFYFSLGWIYSNSLNAEQIAQGKNIFIFITVYLLASFFSQTLNGITLAYENYQYSSIVAICRTASRTLLLVVLILKLDAAIVIAIVDAALNSVIALFSYIYCRKKFKIKINFRSFDKSIFKASLPFCLAIFLQAIMNQANNNVDKFIISIKLNPETVSLYSVALYIYGVFSSLTTIPVSMYMPQVTKDVVAGVRGKDLTKTLIQPSRLIVLIGGAILGGFFAVGQQFVSIVYGDSYMLAWGLALILMAPMFVNMSTAMALNVLDVMNKRLVRSFALLFTTIANIILTIIFIDLWGVIGATIATAICLFLGNILMMDIYYSRAIGIKVIYMYFKTYKGILIYQILGAIAGFFVGKIPMNTYLSFLLGGITFVVIAFGGYFLLGRNSAEKEITSKIIKKLKKQK